MNQELLEYLKDKPIITKATIKKKLTTNNQYAQLVLQRLISRKEIKRITTGKYTTKNNIYEICSHLETPSYISLTTASMIKGHTEQIINQIHVITNKNKKFIYDNYKINLIKSNKLFGYIKLNNPEIFLAEDEKLLLDMLTYQKETGNLQEIIKVIKNSEINKEKIVKYLKKYDNQSLTKRTGFLLEKYKKIDISKNFKLDNNKIFLDKLTKKEKKIDNKWKVKHDIN